MNCLLNVTKPAHAPPALSAASAHAQQRAPPRRRTAARNPAKSGLVPRGRARAFWAREEGGARHGAAASWVPGGPEASRAGGWTQHFEPEYTNLGREGRSSYDSKSTFRLAKTVPGVETEATECPGPAQPRSGERREALPLRHLASETPTWPLRRLRRGSAPAPRGGLKAPPPRRGMARPRPRPPGLEKPVDSGGQFMGSQRVRHNWGTNTLFASWEGLLAPPAGLAAVPRVSCPVLFCPAEWLWHFLSSQGPTYLRLQAGSWGSRVPEEITSALALFTASWVIVVPSVALGNVSTTIGGHSPLLMEGERSNWMLMRSGSKLKLDLISHLGHVPK